MDLKGLDQLGRMEKEVSLTDATGNEWKFKMHTLSVVEQQRALKSIPPDAENEVEKFSYLQISTLTESTDEVNGEKVGKTELNKLYSGMQYNVLSTIFAQYLELTADQDKIITDLKKN